MAMMPPQMAAAPGPPGAAMPPTPGLAAAVPSAAPPGGAGGGFAQMMAKLTQRGAGGQLPPEMMTLLTFLAGLGFEPFTRAIDRLKPKEPKGGAAVRADAQRGAPGMAVPPQLAQLAQLAAMGGGQPGALPVR